MKHHAIAFGIVAAGLIAGCSSGQPDLTESQKQDAILADPMGYKPDMSRNVTSGDITTFDKPGIGKDLNDMLNP
jgi:hypothetical protein